tara:strand:- start:474 stop:1733 length:1260 start_codon:yes stop_codon:yes gene_type:complete
MSCANVSNRYLNCSEKNGQYFWKLDDEPLDGVCPSNSIPWRVHALCNSSDTSLCYETSLGEDRVAVCVVPTKHDGTTMIKECGLKYLQEEHLIQHDVPIEDAAYFKDKTICTKQNIGQLKGAEIVTWVPDGREDLCDEIVDQARSTCNGKNDCDYKFERIYEKKELPSYDCVIDTKNVPSNERNYQWWNWIRTHSYSCKDKGWTCTDESMSEYKGGELCIMKDDCHKNAEFGVCSNKQCVLGAAIGTNCSKDEDCDLLNNVEGECTNGRCSEGKNGLNVSYYKPQECNEYEKINSHSLYQYCGNSERSTYTGYCNAIPGTSKKVCKAFENYSELQHVKDEEENYLRGIRHPQNFYPQTPPWENLEVCSDYITVNGKRICTSTTEKIDAYLGTVEAADLQTAENKCKRRFDVPVLTLPSF